MKTKKILSAILGIVMLFNLMFATPLIVTDVEAAEAGMYYNITADTLNSNGCITTTNITTSYVKDGITSAIKMTANAAVDDPQVTIDFSKLEGGLPAELTVENYKYLVVCCRVSAKSSSSGNTEVFYDTDLGISGSRMSSFSTSVSNDYVCYILTVKGTGPINGLRFDTFKSLAANDCLYLDSLGFCEDYETAQARARRRGQQRNDINESIRVFEDRELSYLFNTGSEGKTNNDDTFAYDVDKKAVKLYTNKEHNDPYVYFNAAGITKAGYGTSTGIDKFNADTYKYVVVTYMSSQNTNLELRLLSNGKTAANTDVRPTYSVKADGEFHSIIVDLTEYANWTGSIDGIRIDYADYAKVGDYLYIRSIGFAESRSEASTWAIDNITNYDTTGYNYTSGRFIASHDTVAMIDEYYNSDTTRLYEYDNDEDALKITMLEDDSNAPDPKFELHNYGPASTANDKNRVVITYMIPENQATYTQGRIRLNMSGDTLSYNDDYSATFDLIADGMYHSYIVDLTTMPVYTAGASYDGLQLYFNNGPVSAGECIYLDSIIFCTEADAEKQALVRSSNKNSNAGSRYIFEGDPTLIPYFTAYGGASNCTMTYDSAEQAIKILTKDSTPSTGTGDVGYTFDFSSAGTLSTSVYKYVVITYKSNHNNTGEGDLFHLVNGQSASGERSTAITHVNDAEEYHAIVANASAMGTSWTGNIRGFRYDFFDNSYAGDELYIDSIVYCDDLNTANYTAWERTSARNHPETSILTEKQPTDVVMKHWEQDYLVTADSNYTITSEEKISSNGTATDTGAIKVVEKSGATSGITYNIEDGAFAAGYQKYHYRYLTITYKAEKENTNCTVYFMVNGVTTVADAKTNGYYKTFELFSDVDGKSGSEFHALRIDLTDFIDMEWWKGNINGFCLDFSNEESGDLTVYIESVVLSRDTEINTGYAAFDHVNNINGTTIYETDSDGNTLKYHASPEMVYLFTNRHMCKVSYDKVNHAIAITVCNYCEASYLWGNEHNDVANGCTCSGGKFTGADGEGAFDTGIRFNLPSGGAGVDQSRYMVASYMTPTTENGLEDIIGYHPSPSTDTKTYYKDNVTYTIEDLNYAIDVGIYPVTSSGTESSNYSRVFEISEQGAYYASFVDLQQQGYDGETLGAIRIDPFNITFAQLDRVLYISTIALAPTQEKAQDIVDEQLDKYYPYNYILNFDQNLGTDTETGVTIKNFPTGDALRSDEKTFNYSLKFANPTREYYDFNGWKTAANGTGDSYTTEQDFVMTGPDLPDDHMSNPKRYDVEAKLYAQWTEHEATITYQVVKPDGYTAEVADTALLLRVSDSVKKRTGTVGADNKPQENISNYGLRFVGWYLDEACTQPATSTAGAATLSVSDMEGDKLTDANNIVYWNDITYYAKFDYAYADLTIKFVNIPDSDADQSFIVDIVANEIKDDNIDESSFNSTLAISGEGTIIVNDLYVGSYTVTVQGGWSWRFSVQAQNVEIVDQAVEITFDFGDTTNNDKWLNDYGYTEEIK